MGTYNGHDNSHLRYDRTSLTASGVQVMVEEDTTYDSETNHVGEVVEYLAVEGNGTLTAEVYVSGSAEVTKYYYADGQRVAMREAGPRHWLLTDHLGSTAVQFPMRVSVLRVTFESDTKSATGLKEYLVVYGQAQIEEGGAPELLQKLAQVYLGPDVKFPPMDDPPPDVITRIQVERASGVGPWTGRAV